MRPLRLGLALLLLGAGCVGDGGAPSGDHARGGEGEGEGEPGGPGEVAGEGEPPCPEGTRSADGECHPSQGEPDEAGEGEPELPDEPGAAFVLGVNFQPAGGQTPAGWVADTGLAFDAGRGFGWGSDISGKTRRRGMHGDPLLDTAIFPGEQGRAERWELVVPEGTGTLLVSVASGDPLAEQGPNRIVAEGVVLMDSTVSAAGQFLTVRDQEVRVADGRLTLEVGDGADDTALNWIAVRTEGQAFPGDGPPDDDPPDDDPPDDDPPDDDPPDDDPPDDDPPDARCVLSSLADAGAIDGAGFDRQAGAFRDGGWAVDNQCDRLRRRLAGDWSTGSIAFDARGLLWAQPDNPDSHGCERFILNMNRGSDSGPGHARMWFASMTAGCAGSPRGNLRVGLSDGSCCNDSRRMPDADNGGWRRFELSWDPERVRVTVDGEVWIDGGSGGAHVGSDVDLEFGSECAGGDQNLAVFRNLEICPG